MQKLLRKAYQGEGRRRPARRPTQTAGGCPTLYPRPTLPPRRGSQCGPPTRQAMQRPYPQEGAGSTFRPRSAAMASRDIAGRDQPPNTHATTGIIPPAVRLPAAPQRGHTNRRGRRAVWAGSHGTGEPGPSRAHGPREHAAPRAGSTTGPSRGPGARGWVGCPQRRGSAHPRGPCGCRAPALWKGAQRKIANPRKGAQREARQTRCDPDRRRGPSSAETRPCPG